MEPSGGRAATGVGLVMRPVWRAGPATAALCLLTVVTAVSYGALFSGGALVTTLVIAALVLHGLAFLLRLARCPLWVALPLEVGVVVVILGMALHRDTTSFGVLPSWETITRLADDLATVWEQFPTALVPVPEDSAFATAALASIGLVAVTADAFAFRALGRLESLAPATVTFIVVSAVAAEDEHVTLALVWLATALLALALLRAAHDDGRSWIGRHGAAVTLRRSTGALAVVLVAVGATAWLAPRLPGAGEPPLIDTRNSPNEVTEILSPLVDIRSRLVNRSNTTLFTVAADRGEYWRLTGLPSFDGRTWNLPDGGLAGGGVGKQPPTSDGNLLEQRIEIRALGSNLVPAAYTPVAAGVVPTDGGAAAGTELRFAEDTGTLVATGGGLRRGLQIDVVSLSLAPPPALLRATTNVPPSSQYLALPDDYPDEFRSLARDVTAGANTGYDQALTLQNWFRSEFTYDLEVPAGHGDDAIADFLERRRGYCEQFAGTFAAFARSIGLPARVAVGFTSGDEDASGRFVVRGRHAHAWPEVWFDGVGWVLFEPTPGRGAPGAEGWTGVPPAQESRPPQDQDTTATTSPTTSPATSVPGGGPPTSVAADGGSPSTTVVPVGGTSSRGGSPTGAVLLALLAAVLAWTLAMPPLVRMAARARRRSPTDRVVGAWRSAANAIAATGVRRRQGETPLEHARRAARATGLDPSSLTELATHATVAVYATTECTERNAQRCEDLHAYIVTASREMLPFDQRVRMRLDPRRVAETA